MEASISSLMDDRFALRIRFRDEGGGPDKNYIEYQGLPFTTTILCMAPEKILVIFFPFKASTAVGISRGFVSPRPSYGMFITGNKKVTCPLELLPQDMRIVDSSPSI